LAEACGSCCSSCCCWDCVDGEGEFWAEEDEEEEDEDDDEEVEEEEEDDDDEESDCCCLCPFRLVTLPVLEDCLESGDRVGVMATDWGWDALGGGGASSEGLDDVATGEN
jgi:hypothetical protein